MAGWTGWRCRFVDGLHTGRKGEQWTWQRCHSMRQRCRILSNWPIRQRLATDSTKVSWTRHQLPCRCLRHSTSLVLQSFSAAANVSIADMLPSYISHMVHVNCVRHDALQCQDYADHALQSQSCELFMDMIAGLSSLVSLHLSYITCLLVYRHREAEPAFLSGSCSSLYRPRAVIGGV